MLKNYLYIMRKESKEISRISLLDLHNRILYIYIYMNANFRKGGKIKSRQKKSLLFMAIADQNKSLCKYSLFFAQSSNKTYLIYVKEYTRCSYEAIMVILPLSTCPKRLNVTA